MISIKNQERMINLSAILFLSIPLFLITGPLIPDLFLVIISLNFIFLTYTNKKFKIFKNKFFLLSLLFCLMVTLVSILSLNNSSIQSGAFYFRFILFSIASYNLLQNRKFIFRYLFYSIIIIYLILFFDSIYQYNFSENIIGLKYINQNFRITSFFGDDEILGSYTARLFPFLFFLIIFYFNNNPLKKRIILTILSIISFVIVILSGERTALALFILSILFIFFSSINLRKILILPIIVGLITFVSIITVSDKIKKRLIDTTLNQLGLVNQSDRLIIFSETYEGHYLVALKMFKEKPFFGHGAKMFRFYCAKEENFVKEHACTTHPHNFYAQMLAEVGFVGFFSLISIFVYILYLFLKNFYYQARFKTQLISDLGVCLLASYFITLFPLLPSGNFFNNWLSIIIYYPMGFLLYIINKNKFYA